MTEVRPRTGQETWSLSKKEEGFFHRSNALKLDEHPFRLKVSNTKFRREDDIEGNRLTRTGERNFAF